MRRRELLWVVAVVAFAAGLGASGQAQSTGCVQSAQTMMVFYAGVSAGKVAFSGTIKTTFEQKLADGNVIRAVIHTRDARDSSGRTMVQGAQGCARGEDGQIEQRLSVQVNDPVAGTGSSWYVGGTDSPKVLHVYHQSAPLPPRVPPPHPPTPEELAQQQQALQAHRAQQAELQKDRKIEDLGAKQINGVLAQGTRTTRTIPAGLEGNEKPLVLVDERWQSKDLGLVLYFINDDPRRGRTVEEYEELTLREPDAALFALPADYTVVDSSTSR